MKVPYGFVGVLEDTAGISYIEKINKLFVEKGLEKNKKNSRVLT